ncbi:MAG: Hpt domain-containing protein [Devosia sp.]
MSQNVVRVDHAPAPSRRTPVDCGYLSRQTMGDPGLEAEVLRLFEVMAHTYMERLKAAADVEARLMSLHTLKGAAAGIGATVLAELARAVEARLRGGEMLTDEMLDRLGFAVDDVSEFIASRLDQLEVAA